jgi:hypothetical protein
VKSKSNDPPVAPSNSISSTSPISFSIGSSVIDKQIEWKPSFINIAEVLKWPVFDNLNFDRRLYLLSQPEEDKAQPGLPISVDLDLQAADSLLRRFFDDVHIFNPTLKEEDVREYVKIVSFNGIGWDATSCLLVSSLRLLKSSVPYLAH